jgi:hypothetical protein
VSAKSEDKRLQFLAKVRNSYPKTHLADAAMWYRDLSPSKRKNKDLDTLMSEYRVYACLDDPE